MKIWPFTAPVLAASLTTLATVTPGAARAQRPADYAVKFLGRTIDLRPHLQGFPYLGWNADFDAGRLFYFHETAAGRFLIAQPLGGRGRTARIDPAAGRRVHDVDWSKRNFLSMRFDSVGGDMLVHADERNDEVGNLYRLSLRTGALTKLTDVPYIYGWDISPDGRRVALGLVDAGKPPDIWIFDVNRGSLSRFPFGPASNFNPVWTPDGSRIIYSSERPVFDLYAKPADSGGDEQLIATTSRDKCAGSVSPDGRVLLGTSSVEDEGENLWPFR